MTSKTKNVAASVHQRLLNHARQSNRSLNELLQLYAMERFLYRLSCSPCKNQFVLKGALMFVAWDMDQSRTTMDIDLLGFTENSLENIEKKFLSVCILTPEIDDGLQFDQSTIKTERIQDDAECEGVRVTFICFLGSARISMQIDVGFDDIVQPQPEKISYPTLLNYPIPDIMGYTPQSVIAEKFEAMVKLGELNSRMKDFFDIWLLAKQTHIDKRLLADAMKATFERRGTVLEAMPLILSLNDEKLIDKQKQWKAFLIKNKLTYAPKKFSEVTAYLSTFLTPVVSGLSKAKRI